MPQPLGGREQTQGGNGHTGRLHDILAAPALDALERPVRGGRHDGNS
ncbi:hypothetical protein ACFC5Z_35735 [Streptomyces sp. NPDC056004]